MGVDASGDGDGRNRSLRPGQVKVLRQVAQPAVTVAPEGWPAILRTSMMIPQANVACDHSRCGGEPGVGIEYVGNFSHRDTIFPQICEGAPVTAPRGPAPVAFT
jgi:hypothetical protein